MHHDYCPGGACFQGSVTRRSNCITRRSRSLQVGLQFFRDTASLFLVIHGFWKSNHRDSNLFNLFTSMQEETTVSIIIGVVAVLVACVGIYVTWRVTRGKPTAFHCKPTSSDKTPYRTTTKTAASSHTSTPYAQPPTLLQTKDRRLVR